MRQSVVTAPGILPRHPGVDGHHCCTECPVCGTEECPVLQDLGMSCDTAQAAREAKGLRWGVRRRSEPPGRAARTARR